MSVAPTVIETTELEEMLDKSVPCEATKCRSNHSQPATWLFTHHGGTPCATLYCEACRQSLQNWLDSSIKENAMQKFDCVKCSARFMSYNDLIFRRL